MIEAKGSSGSVTFDGEYVTIRHGAMSPAGRSEKRVHISQITGVRWRSAGLFGGFIQFSMAGSVESAAGSTGGQAAARRDGNAMTFNSRRQRAFEELRAAVEAALAERHTAE